MDLYHIWVDLKPGVRDALFVEALNAYLGMLKSKGAIEHWRLTRRKLGLGPADLGEFHIIIETRDLAQLDSAFAQAATRADPIEQVHFGVNSLVCNFKAALYRDFPDPVRLHGAEKF